MRVYATPEEYADWLGLAEAPAGAAQALRTASLRVGELVLSALYDVDEDGYPTDTTFIEAFMEATCAQAAHARTQGDAEGDGVSPFSEMSIGSIRLKRATPADDSSVTAKYSSDAVAILQQAGLIPAEPWTW